MKWENITLYYFHIVLILDLDELVKLNLNRQNRSYQFGMEYQLFCDFP